MGIEGSIYGCWPKKVSEKLFWFSFSSQNGQVLLVDSQEMLGWDPLKHRIMIQEVDKGESCQKSGTEAWFWSALNSF